MINITVHGTYQLAAMEETTDIGDWMQLFQDLAIHFSFELLSNTPAHLCLLALVNRVYGLLLSG